MLRQIAALFLVMIACFATANGTNTYDVRLPKVIMLGVKQAIVIEMKADSAEKPTASKVIQLNGKPLTIVFQQHNATINYDFPKEELLRIEADDFSWEQQVNPIPLWMSVLPPLVAIALALLLKEVFTALFVGILVGTTIMYSYQGLGFFMAIGKGFLAVIDTYVMESLLDKGHLSIIVFSMVIGGMVQLISVNGGMMGVVNRLSKLARTPRSGQLVTWLLGVVIFFDDYANTLVVGNTMQPVVDRLKVSRAKLAYIVDSTAAPVAAIAFVTTWIGAELSYIQAGLDVIGLHQSAYTVFLNSLAFSFYPILTLIFILMLVWQQREYGPMLKAETLARNSSATRVENNPKNTKNSADNFLRSGKKPRAINAILPVAVIIFGTLAGLIYTGWDSSIWHNEQLSTTTRISEIIGRSNSYAALLWSSISALVVAIVLTLSQKLLKLTEAMESVIEGFRVMLTAIVILTLAWSVALVTDHLHTADFIAESLMRISFSPYLIPAFTFVLAALVAFSTGTSWGTMAILYPLILPSSWLLTTSAGIEHTHSLTIFYSVVSSVLSGAILGDHVSPISDTTILSSISSGCNHIEHVRTQMPYALTVGLVAIFIGTIPAAFGIPTWILMLISIAVLWGLIRLLGKKIIPTEKASNE
ncbi:MAG: hypothetical protein IT219_09715 [Bacteroidales bacterium]|nr:hypothetical protein [Bacteroidales bacterium]